jgi:DNA mismatch endonuclease, patch repair protein
MLANQPTDSGPEIALARALRRLGLHCRKYAAVPTAERSVRVDFVFPRARVAVFVDGCFWHSCPAHATWPRRNRSWWQAKLAENAARDKRQSAALKSSGWKVLRIWAHEKPDIAARRVARAVRPS